MGAVVNKVKAFRGRTAFRADERGGAMIVMAFSIMAVVLLAGLSSFAMVNGVTALSQRVNQASESSVRSAVDTVLTEVNLGGQSSTQDILESLVGREFAIDGDGPVQGETTITAATFDGRNVHLELSVVSTGRMEWERRGTSTLELARAVSLSRIDNGRAVWDFAAPTGANSEVDEVVALWTPGELEVFVPGLDVDDPTAPNPAAITTDINADGVASVAVAYAGGCWAGETERIEVRKRVGDGEWSTYASVESFSMNLDKGQSGHVEARVRCTSSERTSNWAMKNVTIKRAAETYRVPTPLVEVSPGEIAISPRAPDRAPADATVSTQVRIKTGDGAWSSWHTTDGMSVAVEPGVRIQVQARARVLHADGADTGWVESNIATRTSE